MQNAIKKLKSLSIAIALLVLSGCVSVNPSLVRLPGQNGIDTIVAAGFYEIEETYVEEIDMGWLGFSAIKEIESFDNEIILVRSGDTAILRYRRNELGRFNIPESHHSLAWGNLAADIFETAKDKIPNFSANEEEYETAILTSITTELDQFSRYVTAEDAANERARRTGYGGIGLSFDRIGDNLVIRKVFENSPAARARLREGDTLTNINDRPVESMSLTEARDNMRGPTGSTVRLHVVRLNVADFDVTLRRENVVPNMITAEQNGQIGIIRIAQFNATTARDLRRATESLRDDIIRQSGQNPEGFIIDIRGNPGGMLDQAVDAADLFIGNGDILTTQGRHPNSRQHYRADRQDILHNIPIIVLINGRSASASEIMAAAMQDSGRATIIGTTSYGKGSVQTVTRLPNDGELLITWAYFYAPSGYRIHHLGVTPNICISENETPEEVISRINQNGFDIPRDIRLRRQLASTEATINDNNTQQSHLRALCPPSDNITSRSEDVAIRLLEEGNFIAYSIQRGF